MHLRAVDVHVELQLDTDVLDVLETLLVVGASTAHPDLNLVLVQLRGDLAESADHTLESAGDVGEVGNTTTDEENLAFGVLRCAQHQVEDRAGVVVGLRLRGGAGVFTVVGELADEAGRGDGVGVDDGRTTTGNESPDATRGVENGQLERGTGLGVHVGNVLLLLGQLTAERRRELHWGTSIDGDAAISGSRGEAERSVAAGRSPFRAALEIGGLVELRGHVKEVDVRGGGIGVGNDHKRVDLEVGELAVDVDSVETGDEVDQDVVKTGRNLLEQRRGNLVVGGILREVDRDEELLGLRIDITDIDTTFVREENPVALW